MVKNASFDEAFKTYFKAGITSRIGFGEKAAVLVVDMTKGFTHPEYQLGTDLSEVVNKINILLKKAREKETPIFFTLCEYREDMKDAGVWGKKLPSAKNLQIGTEQVDIDPRLNPLPGELIIRKKFPSCFFGTPLISYLVTNRVDTLIVTGTTTSGCVRATVVDALQYGFRTIVPRECVGDRAQAPHDANLFDMGMKYADVVDLQEVLDYLG